MRIDSSGRLLLGKTAVDNTTVGFRFDGASGFASFVRDGGEPLYLNRKTSDGDVVKIAKDGTVVGVIGTQNWGIGTSSPQSRLDLGSGSSSGEGISFGTTLTEIRRGGTNGDTLQTSHWGNVAVLIDSDNNDSSTRAFKVMEGNTDAGTANELFRVRSDGRVGIGTTSPATLLHLYANDPTITLDDSGTQSSITGQSGNILYKTSSANRDHVFYGVSTEVARITGDGNVGIGTTSPQAHLDINTETAEATTVILNGEANQDKILKFRHHANSEAAGNGYAGFIGSVVDMY